MASLAQANSVCFGITCVASNCFQMLNIRNPANGQTESYGPTRHSGGGGPANNPVPSSFFSYGPISASFQYGGFESVTTGNTAWTNAMPSNVRSSVYYSNTPLSNNGIFPAGTYQIYHWNHYGAGSGNTILAKTATGFVAFGGQLIPTCFYGKSGTSYPARAFVLDATDSSIPALGPNSGFGDVPFGTAANFNKICVTSSGHTMFMESTSIACTPDAVLAAQADNGKDLLLLEPRRWECNTITKEFSGKLETYSQIQIPLLLVLQAQEMGDSHALDRTIAIHIRQWSLRYWNTNKPCSGT